MKGLRKALLIGMTLGYDCARHCWLYESNAAPSNDVLKGRGHWLCKVH